MFVKINKKKYIVNDNEYTKFIIDKYNFLCLHNDLDIHDILIGFIKRIVDKQVYKKNNNCNTRIIHINPSHGGFILLNLVDSFNELYYNCINKELHFDNIKQNMYTVSPNNIFFEYDLHTICREDGFSLILNDDINNTSFSDIPLSNNFIIISKVKLYNTVCKQYFFNKINYYVYISHDLESKFNEVFKFYICDDVLNYDNLANLCIMVKNAGPQFRDMLLHNIQFFDKWTILDTGSTDGTLDIIEELLIGKKEGVLFKEPFINFRDSRNRLLDLAGTECKYLVMLDDTYLLKGDMRAFLNAIRSDQYADSFSLMVHTDDLKYGSNRITKSSCGLRYIFKIHEVINNSNNINVIVPEENVYIFDGRFDYMHERTMERKQLDLKLLYEELEENANEPRTYYYLAQTYSSLGQYEKAFYYFGKRAEITNTGFIQERIDAVFEAARLANFELNKPWSECEQMYLNAYKMDETRPDSLYFIGIHYYLENDYSTSHSYFKKAFKIGFPAHCQYGLKPTISFYYLPKFLVHTSYVNSDYETGYAASKLFLSNYNYENSIVKEDYNVVLSWFKIFEKFTLYDGPKVPRVPDKPILCFVADGGFSSWSGANILTTGVGGSETYVIEMARYLARLDYFGEVFVFCNTPNGEDITFEGVRYIHLDKYCQFINTTYVNTVIVSRFSEYLPVTFKGYSENVYLVVHDLTTSGVVIVNDKKLKQIFCMSEWHTNYFTNVFTVLKDITSPFYCGIDDKYLQPNPCKIKHKFIYSSFPNRGLLQLLQMWPSIYAKYPNATLFIYSDVDNKWSNEVEPDKMNEIKQLLNYYGNNYGVNYKGWVSKKELANAWASSDIWFYPCTFQETFCLTALEAAASKTLAITNGLAALENTVGNRGVIIPGDPTSIEWQQNALQKIFYIMDERNQEVKMRLINMNYEWAKSLTWKNQAQKLFKDYLFPNNKFEYKGMYNWTNDAPEGSKHIFSSIISYFNSNYNKVKFGKKIEILEIGTFAGTSLIELVNSIPNSFGTGVDMWRNYDENELLQVIDNFKVKDSFYKNIKNAGLEQRIKGIQIDSTSALVQFIKDGVKFDFIYVDGSHLLLDCYSDLLLSWQILEKDGILAIDDYLFKHNEPNILVSPYQAVNHFFKIFNDQYKTLSIGYRVFLQKL